MTNQYVKRHIKSVMYTILDKLSRIKNVNFEKTDNSKIFSVVSKTAYDILTAYQYLISSDDYLLGSYLDEEIHNDRRWIIGSDHIRLNTIEGLEVTLTVTDTETLDGMNAIISAITTDNEKFIVEELSDSTSISVISNKDEVKVRNGHFIIVKDNIEKKLKKPHAYGLNSAIMFSRNNKQSVYKKY